MSKHWSEVYELAELQDDLLATLLHNRGINEPQAFIDPQWDGGHDPFAMADMQVAVDRILAAIDADQQIVIFSDYDADGVPGGALLADFFNKIGYENCTNYIPNRNTDGFGLNPGVCQQFVDDGVDLVITVDCGIADVAEVQQLQDGGVDVIVTDHHLPGDQLPAAVAVLDPARADCDYPFEKLCGCGVAFKLVQGLLAAGKQQVHPRFADIPDGWEKWLLDLVGISTLCDMVPLVGENRMLAYYGLLVLNKTRRAGLLKLYSKAGLKPGSITAEDVGFSIGPRINAASRIGDPMIALEMFTAAHPTASAAAAEQLESLNRKRKTMLATIMRQVNKKLSERELTDVIVIGDDNWLPGMLGLIAGKIADSHSRPAFVWTRSGQRILGSVRSGSDIDIHSLMQAGSAGFVSYGGHTAAGGFVTDFEKIHTLQDVLVAAVPQATRVEQAKARLDARLDLSAVSPATFAVLGQLEPYGMGNDKPTFLFERCEVVAVRIFGKADDHLELSLRDSSGRVQKATTFFWQDRLGRSAAVGDQIDVVATIEENGWGGYKKLELRLVDIF